MLNINTINSIQNTVIAGLSQPQLATTLRNFSLDDILRQSHYGATARTISSKAFTFHTVEGDYDVIIAKAVVNDGSNINAHTCYPNRTGGKTLVMYVPFYTNADDDDRMKQELYLKYLIAHKFGNERSRNLQLHIDAISRMYNTIAC